MTHPLFFSNGTAVVRKDLADFLVGREGGVNPMDGESATLHTTEPRHLALGKLMDGNFETREHLVVSETTRDVFGDELVFQAVLDEVFGRNALSQQAFDFANHSFLQTSFQTTGNLLSTQFTVDIHTNNKDGTGGNSRRGTGFSRL